MKVKLLRPLDGKDIGSVVDYPDADAKRLADSGVVEAVSDKSEKAEPTPENKAALEPVNKMAPEPLNKAAPRGRPRKGA